jgi:hypothetical protein
MLIILLSIIFMSYDEFKNIIKYIDIIIDNNGIFMNTINYFDNISVIFMYYYDKFMNIIKNIDNISIMIFMYIDEFMIIIKINYIDKISI